MSYKRPMQVLTSAPDVAAEMAATLAVASITFKDDEKFSRPLLDNGIKLYHWATSTNSKEPYGSLNDYTGNFYNSTSIFDEHLWGASVGATWLFLATGNFSYLSKATDQGLAADSKAFSRKSDLRASSCDNKLPSAGLLLTRVKMFLDLGYLYEVLLHKYNTEIQLTMCSYLEHYQVFKRMKGGLILLRPGLQQPLQYASHSVFLASLYLDYVCTSGIGVLECGREFALQEDIMKFVTSQVNYILGENPMNMSYLVGYGKNFPGYVHHRGASIPRRNNSVARMDGFGFEAKTQTQT